jgi:hypothetical protein
MFRSRRESRNSGAILAYIHNMEYVRVHDIRNKM